MRVVGFGTKGSTDAQSPMGQRTTAIRAQGNIRRWTRVWGWVLFGHLWGLFSFWSPVIMPHGLDLGH